MATHVDQINTNTHCIVVGEVHPVTIADLIPNTAVQYYLDHPKSKPRWCLRKTAHDVNTCTFLHRNADKASSFIMVRGEPAPVSIGHLIQNKGLEKILGNPGVFGEWCDLASPHDISNCKRLHLGTVADDRNVNVEGEEDPIAVSHLLLNRGASYLLAFPEAKGVWCNNKIIHDVVNCPYIHRRIDGHPKVVTVEDEKFPVPVAQLIPNKALTFLLDNPQCSGRWCGRVTKHEVDECSYLHRVHPYVRVDGESVRITALRSNRGLKYLLEHPEAQGHWCRGTHDEEHPLDTCTFIHLRDESRQERVAAHAQQQQQQVINTGFNNNINGGYSNNSVVIGAGRGPSNRRGGINNGTISNNHTNNNHTGAAGIVFSGAIAPSAPTRGGRGRSTGAPNNHRFSNNIAPHQNNMVNTRNNHGGNNAPAYHNNFNNNNNNNNRMITHNNGNINNNATRPPREPLPVKPVQGNVVVEGASVPANKLVNNAALQYLLNQPTAEGRYCTRVADPKHRDDICHYIHKL